MLFEAVLILSVWNSIVECKD